MDGGEDGLATRNVNAKRVAVRSTAWLDDGGLAEPALLLPGEQMKALFAVPARKMLAKQLKSPECFFAQVAMMRKVVSWADRFLKRLFADGSRRTNQINGSPCPHPFRSSLVHR
jgi:hypothetical protein